MLLRQRALVGGENKRGLWIAANVERAVTLHKPGWCGPTGVVTVHKCGLCRSGKAAAWWLVHKHGLCEADKGSGMVELHKRRLSGGTAIE